MLRIGINGFGRIGRAIFRSNLESQSFKVVAINDINPDIGNLTYTLNYDSLYDRLPELFKFEKEKKFIYDSNHNIKIFHQKHIDEVDWKSQEVDYVIDASGILDNVIRSRNLIETFQAKRVIVTHSPNLGVDFTMVLGANHDEFNHQIHKVIASSICDATAIAPVMKLAYNHFGIDKAYVTTLHPWLNYQNLMDGPASSWSVPGDIHHHYALGRSSIGNMIPKPTSAIQATCKVVKGLSEDFIGSFSFRTPTAIVGCADITLITKSSVTKRDILSLYEEYANSQQWDIIDNNWQPLVSLDFKKSAFSATIDHRFTEVVGNNMVKLVLWYDNEWGYSTRVVDQIKFIESKI
ncbi:MAG: glyceraldehyde 3-phosphate dehydrogenase NAD-binding domain-containing protein [Chloroherpetonaceae bacterium]|nr:glyceraldehyde 3-phosphate dehydrogenase NAD-binding domain-containing protein [Chloroherpetonaceae bacterium]